MFNSLSESPSVIFHGGFKIPVLRIPLHFTENTDEKRMLSDKRFPEPMFGRS